MSEFTPNIKISHSQIVSAKSSVTAYKIYTKKYLCQGGIIIHVTNTTGLQQFLFRLRLEFQKKWRLYLRLPKLTGKYIKRIFIHTYVFFMKKSKLSKWFDPLKTWLIGRYLREVMIWINQLPERSAI